MFLNKCYLKCSKGWFPSNCVHQIKKASNDDSNKKTD